MRLIPFILCPYSSFPASAPPHYIVVHQPSILEVVNYRTNYLLPFPDIVLLEDTSCVFRWNGEDRFEEDVSKKLEKLPGILLLMRREGYRSALVGWGGGGYTAFSPRRGSLRLDRNVPMG
jgi:hypothetical protein